MNINVHQRLIFSGMLLIACTALTSAQASEHSHHDHHAMHDMHGMSAGAHAAHLAMMKKPGMKLSMANYDIPDVTLLDGKGKSVALKTLLNGSHPVAVNFIFTTCTTICPIMSATFAQMHKALGADADRIQQISISIDPEHDSPQVLASYAARYHATSNWRFLTGKPRDIERVLRTFDVWTGTKTNHKPVTLLRGKGDTKWLRVDGLASGSDLAQQARTILN